MDGSDFIDIVISMSEHIEDGYQRGMIYRCSFCRPVCSLRYSEAYDPHPEALQTQPRTANYVEYFRTYCPTEDSYVELNNERSRWRKQKNGLSGECSLTNPVQTFTLMTKPTHDGTRNFIYADDLCVTAQYSSFTEVETTIGDAQEELTQYYRSSSLRANPDKTQVTAFHLRNKEANRSLKVEMEQDKTGEYPTPEVPSCYS